MINIFRKIIKNKCKHKDCIDKTIYDDGIDVYIVKICKKCNRKRTYWQNKYFYPTIPVDEWQ